MNKKSTKVKSEFEVVKNKIFRVKPSSLRLYDQQVRLNPEFRLEENVLKAQKGRLLDNDWRRLQYIDQQKLFTKTPPLLYDQNFKPIRRGYNIFFKKTRLNTFITLTNTSGGVIISRSAGWCGISSKKKKKSSDAFKFICERFAADCINLNINNITNFFSSENNHFQILRQMYGIFFKLNLTISNFILFQSRPHSDRPKLRKLRRI